MKKTIDNKKALIAIIICAVLIDIIAMAIQNNMQAYYYEAMALKAVLIFVSSYYFLKMLTNDNKNILIPATITVSTAEVLLLNNNAIPLICAQFFLILLEKLTQNKVVNTKKKSTQKTYNSEKSSFKLLMILGMLVLTIIMTIPTNYNILTDGAISFSFNIIMLYFVILFSIWILIKNKKNYKVLNVLLGVIVFFVVVVLITVLIVNNEKTILQSTRYSNGLTELFGFMYNFAGLWIHIDNYKWDTAYTIVSVFPVPMIIGMWYLFKNNKNEEFLFPMVVGLTLTSIFAMTGKNLPDIVQTITLAKWVNTTDWVFVTGLLGLYLMFYLMSNTDEKLFSINSAIRLTIGILIVSAIIPFPVQLGTRWMRTLYCIPYTILSFLMIQYNANKKYQRWCVRALATVSIIEFFIYIGFFIGQ